MPKIEERISDSRFLIQETEGWKPVKSGEILRRMAMGERVTVCEALETRLTFSLEDIEEALTAANCLSVEEVSRIMERVKRNVRIEEALKLLNEIVEEEKHVDAGRILEPEEVRKKLGMGVR